MRDDSSPPTPEARSRFDSEVARAMSDVPLPVGLTGRLQAAVKASSVQPSSDMRRLRHASAMTTLNTYGHMWPDADESSRAAVAMVLAAREDSSRTAGVTD